MRESERSAMTKDRRRAWFRRAWFRPVIAQTFKALQRVTCTPILSATA